MKRTDVVCGVIYNSNNEVLITQRGDELNYMKWEFPGGKVKGNEDVFKALEREILEELNLCIKSQKKLHNEEINSSNSVYNLIFIKALYVSGDIKLNEHLDYKWVKVVQLANYDLLEGDLSFIREKLI